MPAHIYLLLLKLTLTPLFIATASLAQRRWGGVVGGLIAGLPLTSGPVSVFLALEHDPAFTANAATGTLFGVTVMAAFCVAYVHAAKRNGYIASALIAAGVCALMTALVSELPQTTSFAIGFTYPALFFLLYLIGNPPTERPSVKLPWWDIPARMSVASVMVLSVTGVAGIIGAKWSGLLSSLPIFGLVMGVFSHRIGGPVAAHALLRGFVVGALGAATFFTVVSLNFEQTSLPMTYGAATLAGLGVVALSQTILWRLQAQAKRRAAPD